MRDAAPFIAAVLWFFVMAALPAAILIGEWLDSRKP